MRLVPLLLRRGLLRPGRESVAKDLPSSTEIDPRRCRRAPGPSRSRPRAGSGASPIQTSAAGQEAGPRTASRKRLPASPSGQPPRSSSAPRWPGDARGGRRGPRHRPQRHERHGEEQGRGSRLHPNGSRSAPDSCDHPSCPRRRSTSHRNRMQPSRRSASCPPDRCSANEMVPRPHTESSGPDGRGREGLRAAGRGATARRAGRRAEKSREGRSSRPRAQDDSGRRAREPAIFGRGIRRRLSPRERRRSAPVVLLEWPVRVPEKRS